MLHSAGRGVVAGDFNPVLPADDTLVAENRLVDAWAELHPNENGYTWGLDGREPFPPGRLDKMATVGLRAQEIEIIHPGVLPESEGSDKIDKTQLDSDKGDDDQATELIPWSDHSGLRCIFNVAEVEPP